jgi:hypothetical protein
MNRTKALGLAALGILLGGLAVGAGIVALSGGSATAPGSIPQPAASEGAAVAPGGARPATARRPSDGTPGDEKPTAAPGKMMVVTGIVTGADVEAATFLADLEGKRPESPTYTIDLRWQGRDVQCRFTSKVGIDRLDDGMEVIVAGTYAGTVGKKLILKDCQLVHPSLDTTSKVVRHPAWAA